MDSFCIWYLCTQAFLSKDNSLYQDLIPALVEGQQFSTYNTVSDKQELKINNPLQCLHRYHGTSCWIRKQKILSCNVFVCLQSVKFIQSGQGQILKKMQNRTQDWPRFQPSTPDRLEFSIHPWKWMTLKKAEKNNIHISVDSQSTNEYVNFDQLYPQNMPCLVAMVHVIKNWWQLNCM